MSQIDKVKYLRVLVDTVDPYEGPTKVNARAPMRLLRAGVRLTGVTPPARLKRSTPRCARKASRLTSTMSRRKICKT